MKILFVYRGYGEDGRNSVVDFQRLSLVKNSEVEVSTFLIKGGGIKSYLRTIFDLRKYLRKNPVDILHAHYSFSGFMAGLATRKPVICSLMGSDVLQQRKVLRTVTGFFCKFVWKVTIVKNKDMQKRFPLAKVIPNGVDFSNFRPIDREEAIKKTGFNSSLQNVIFVAEGPDSTVKNSALAKEALRLLNNENVRLHFISGKKYEELPYYYGSADVLLLTSLSEGSPNVIKEAMACNCPIVTTEVGDVRDVIGNTQGCFITNFDSRDVAAKLKVALDFGKRTSGRETIQRLDSRETVKRLIEEYKTVVKKF